jgi:2-succinyl-5-enolpyruvyl-6-hydroxy-3-cyclohexene-1-carboxylate synthase
MAILQPIIDLVELCAMHRIEHAILCPGSRSAAITMAFVRNPKINCYSISDERSAGFIAIGIALKTKKSVVIVCTSGSAVYNFAPAVVEAFFQQVPILVITADRPAEWIHQNDGQTIYQPNIYGQNVKKSYNLLADFAHPDTNWYYQRTVNEAINYCKSEPKGPVHINIPIREPFYPKSDEIFEASQNINFVKFIESEKKVTNNEIYELLAEIRSYDKILIAVGQTEFDLELNVILEKIQNELHFPVLADVISNIRIEHIWNQDSFLTLDNEDFKPDLLITLGKSFISKSFKKYFQSNKVKSHWHLTNDDKIIDPTQSITKIINIDHKVFLNNLFQDIDNQLFNEGDEELSGEYFEKLYSANRQAEKLKYDFIKEQTKFSEILAYFKCLESLPSNCDLHLANSMAVRYANLLGFDYRKNIEVFANRGTSGIDGCLSTAVGEALHTTELVYLFIGDVAFFYDRNALWNNYLPNNLRIIVFNNAGGGIFRLIDGPSQQPELEDYFETKQNLSAKSTILEAGFDYFSAKNEIELSDSLKGFNKINGKSKCLEIFTDGVINQKVFKEFKAFVKV